MDAEALTIRQILEHAAESGVSRPVQYRVPVFQRTYEWRPDTVEQLIADVLDRVDAGPEARPHFIGSFVLLDEPESAHQPDHLMVIDGQQRLLTIAIAIAIAEQRLGVESSRLRNDGFGIAGRDRIKPARVDREAFECLLRGEQLPGGSRLAQAASRVRHLTEDRPQQDVLNGLLDGLVLVRVLLDKDEDAESVFMSLNYQGQPLTQADLVRTFLLSRFARIDDQESVDDEHWRPMERRLRDCMPERKKRQHASPKDWVVDYYLREWLMRDGGRVDARQVYEKFAALAPSEIDAENVLRELDAVSRHYVPLEAPTPAHRAGDILVRLRAIGYTAHWPLVLQLSRRAERGDFPMEQLPKILAGFESFFVRRAIVRWPTNRLGRLFEQLASSHPHDAADVWPVLQPHWPSDELFVRELTGAPLYQGQYPRNIVMQVLQRLDLSYGNRESKLDPEATIEHVMPQTIGHDANGRGWKEMLGPEWERIHSQYLHTIGNLSVTRTNSEMSNRPFLGPKGKREWLAKSLFEMNRRIAQNERWTEDEIRGRADYFAHQALELWPAVDRYTATEATALIP